MPEPYDLIIVGAGIAGVGIFERAAKSGLRALLIEKDLPGRATTAVTSGLFHGGLRYLPYDLSTSLTMGREAGLLSREFASLVRRQVFLWPVYHGHRVGMELVETLLEHYDSFAGLRRARRHVRLSAEETLKAEPALRSEGLLGALSFEEWSVDVAGLVRALVDDAVAAGGTLLTGHRAVSFTRGANGLDELRTVDNRGRTSKHRARVYVNAGGPWAEEVARMAECSGVRLTLRKGVHLVLEGPSARHALIFPDQGGRYIGLYPRPGGAWVGPTDDAHNGHPGEVTAAAREGGALEEALRSVIPRCRARSVRLTAGLRPLFRQRGIGALLSRDFRIVDHGAEGVDNLITMMGGKLTTFRPMADDALALVRRKLGLQAARPARKTEALSFPLSWVPSRSGALTLPLSAGLLAAAFLRRGLRRLTGRGRRGLDLFRETYRQ